MVRVRNDLTNKKFGRLLVIKQTEDYINPKGVHYAQYECRCECGNPNNIVVSASKLKNGHTKSCGCLNKESHIKLNKYDLNGDYGIGYTSNDKEFYFDLEDYNLIKNYTWYVDSYGYIVSDTKGRIKLHRLVMNALNEDCDIDHKNGRNSRNDNRKGNLRKCSRAENARNKTYMSNNTSNCIGVCWNSSAKKWQARITVDKKDIYLGIFDNKDEAIQARLEAENKYFGEFSPIRKGD